MFLRKNYESIGFILPSDFLQTKGAVESAHEIFFISEVISLWYFLNVTQLPRREFGSSESQ